MAPVTLGYWQIRGLAQPIRLLLELGGIEYKEDIYTASEDNDKTCWTDKKFTLGLTFPNLPYLFDGDVHITQSAAILRHLARRAHLDGKDDAEKAFVDMCLEECRDVQRPFTQLCYGSGFADKKDSFIETAPARFKRFEDLLADGDRAFLAGSQPTVADCLLWEAIYCQQQLIPDLIDKYPKLQAYYKRFADLPKIKEYLASDRYKHVGAKINNPSATFR